MRLREGFDLHLIGTVTMKDKVELDKGVLKSTLNMCRDEGDFEAFVDAIPGYLRQTDHDIGISEFNEGIRIDNIGSLFESKGKDPPLRQRFVHLFTSCTHDHRRIDEGARRRRAITCSRAIWEMSKVPLSVKKKGHGPGLESPAKIHRRNSPSFDLRHRFRDRNFGAEDHGCFKTRDYGTILARGSQGGHRPEIPLLHSPRLSAA